MDITEPAVGHKPGTNLYPVFCAALGALVDKCDDRNGANASLLVEHRHWRQTV